MAKKIRVWDTTIWVAYEKGISPPHELRAEEAEWDGKEQKGTDEAEEEKRQERDQAEEDKRVGMSGETTAPY